MKPIRIHSLILSFVVLFYSAHCFSSPNISSIKSSSNTILFNGIAGTFSSIKAPGNEVDFINPVLPTLVVCGTSGRASIQIVKLANGNNITGNQLTIDLDPGLIYDGNFSANGCSGTNSGVNFRADLSTAGKLVFDFPNMSFGTCGSITLSFDLKVDCSILNLLAANPNLQLNWIYTFDYSGGFDTKIESPIPSLGKPQLTISNPGGITTTSGSVVERTFTICQTGVDAYIDDPIILKDLGSSGMNVRSVKVNGGSEIASYVTGSAGNKTITIPPSEFVNAKLALTNTLGNANTVLNGPVGGNPSSKAECITITEVIEVNSCSNLNSTVFASWGCNSQQCEQSETINPGIAIDLSAGPVIGLTENLTTELCIGQNYTHEFTLRNNGTAAAIDLDVDVFIYTDGVQPMYTCNGSSLDPNSFQYSINGGAFQSVVPSYNLVLGDCSSFLSCFQGEQVVSLSTIRIPRLNVGDQAVIRYIKKTCCPSTSGYYFANGEAVRANFKDACGNSKSMQAQAMNQIYALSPAQIINETATDVDFNNPFSINLVYHELVFSNTSANTYFEVNFSLPPGVIWTGNVSDFMWRDPRGNMLVPSNLVYQSATSSVSARFYVDQIINSGFARANTEIILKGLTVDCNNVQNNPVDNIFDFDIKYIIDPSCTCGVSVASSIFPVEIHCDKVIPVLCEGLDFRSYNLARTTLGLKDSNGDGLPDNGSSANPNVDALKLNRVIAGDELTGTFIGVIQDTAAPTTWQYLYAESKFENASETEITSAKIVIYDKSTGRQIVCNNIPHTFTNDNYVFDLSRSTLLSSGCADADLAFFGEYAVGDSIVFEVKYHFITNIPYAITDNFVDNTIYLSQVANPTKEAGQRSLCGDYSSRFTYYGYVFEQVASSPILSGCEEKSFNYQYTYNNEYVFNSPPSDLFPYEYRSQMILKEVSAQIPNGYKFVRAEAILISGRGSGIAITSSPENIVPVNPSSSNLVFNLSNLYKSVNASGPWQDPDDGFTVSLNLFLSPQCSSPETGRVSGLATGERRTVLNSIAANGNNVDPLDDISLPFKSNTQFDIVYYSPSLIIQSPQQNINGNNLAVQWPVVINNLSPSTTAKNVWVSFTNSSGQIQVNSVQRGLTTITPGPGGLFRLGDLLANGGQIDLKVNATINRNCNKDSLIVLMSWNCNEYPNTVAQSVCTPISFPLYVQPLNTDLELTVLTPKETAIPKVYGLCEDIEFVLQIDNIGQANAFNALVDAYLPANFELIPNSSYIQYKVNSIVPPSPNVSLPNWVKVGEPTNLGASSFGQKMQWNISSLWTTATGNTALGSGTTGIPYQVLNPDSSKFYLRFLAQTKCGFITNTRIPFVASAQSPCQVGSSDYIKSIVESSTPIHIIDPNSLYGARLKLNADTLLLQVCSSNEVEILMYNFGPGSTRLNDSIKIDLPLGYNYISGSTVAIKSFGGSEPIRMNRGTAGTKLCWPIAANVAAGDSLKFKFSLSLDPAILACSGQAEFINMVLTTRDLFCEDNAQLCRTQLVLAEAKHPVKYQKSLISLGSQNVTCPDVKGQSTVQLQIKLTQSSMNSSHYVRVRIFEDLNRNKILDANELASTPLSDKSFNGPYNMGTISLQYLVSIPLSKLENSIFYIDGDCLCSSITQVLYAPICKSCIQVGDYVWLDENKNGIQDPAERGINGLEVSLYDGLTGRLVSTYITGRKPGTQSDDGYFKFCECEGSYYLKFQTANNYTHSPVQAGTNRAIDSDVSNSNGPNTTNTFKIVDGQMYCDIDAGFYNGSSLGDYVWLDLNANGLQDIEEPKVKDVKVKAINLNGETLGEAITDQKGYFVIKAVPDGSCYLKFDPPSGYSFTKADANNDDSKDSDVTNAMGFGTTKVIQTSNALEVMNLDAGLSFAVLSIDELSLKAEVCGSSTCVNWSIVHDGDCSEVILEAMDDPKEGFKPIHRIIDGFTSGRQDFEFVDSRPYSNAVRYYRVREGLESGIVHFSNIVSVSKSKDNTSYLTLYPNPAESNLFVHAKLKSAEELTVNVLSIEGKQVIQLDKIKNSRSLYFDQNYDVRHLPQGQYILELVQKTYIQSIPFVKQ